MQSSGADSPGTDVICMFLSRSIWQSRSWNCSAVKAVPNFTSPALFREVLFPTLWLTVLSMYFTLSLQAYLCNKPSAARFRAFEMCRARLSPFPWLILLIPNPWLSSCRFQLKHYCLLEDLEDCSYPRGRPAQYLLCPLSPPAPNRLSCLRARFPGRRSDL